MIYLRLPILFTTESYEENKYVFDILISQNVQVFFTVVVAVSTMFPGNGVFLAFVLLIPTLLLSSPPFFMVELENLHPINISDILMSRCFPRKIFFRRTDFHKLNVNESFPTNIIINSESSWSPTVVMWGLTIHDI